MRQTENHDDDQHVVHRCDHEEVNYSAIHNVDYEKVSDQKVFDQEEDRSVTICFPDSYALTVRFTEGRGLA